ncbi:CRTAC1 family protein, partial [Pseudomonadota bacterium]
TNYRLDPNQLWMGAGTGIFEDRSSEVGVRGTNVSGAFGHSIGGVSGDIDNDGGIDLFISNLAHPRYMKFSDLSMVLLNQGNPEFKFFNMFENSGIKYEETVSDPLLFDADNDGDLDLYFTSIYRGRQSFLYRNDGSGHFTDISWQSGARVANGWGVAAADYDLDGHTDILVASADGIRLLRNQGNGNHWLSIRHQSQACNRFGVGNRVTISYAGAKQVRYVSAGKGTGTQNSLALQFGLGSHEGSVKVESVDLCGGVIELDLGSGNRHIIIRN